MLLEDVDSCKYRVNELIIHSTCDHLHSRYLLLLLYGNSQSMIKIRLKQKTIEYEPMTILTVYCIHEIVAATVTVVINHHVTTAITKRNLLYPTILYYTHLPSVLWHCWFGSRKVTPPVKNWVVGCWHGYLSGVRCRVAYGPANATATHCLLLQ